MGKGGSAPSGNTTTTVQQNNPLANAQLYPLNRLWGSADYLRENPNDPTYNALYNLQQYAGDQGWNTAGTAYNIMPTAATQYLNQINQGVPSQAQANQLTANAAGAVNQGLNYSGALSGAANTALGQVPYWQQQFQGAGQNALNTLQGYGSAATNALSGVGNYAMNTLPGMGQGALTGLSNLSGQAATAGNPAEAGLYGAANAALANPALSSGLRGLASGAYINPSTNPAYAGMIQAATQPLVNQYMTATAPQVASQFEGAGRYGSGAQTNAQGQAQYGLGQALGTDIAGITNNAYNTGINATLGAGQALGGLYNTGISNITNALGTSGQLAQAGTMNAGNLLNQGYTTGGNLINQGIAGGTNALSNAYNIGGGLTGQGFNAQNAAMANAANTGLGYLNAGISGLGAGAGAAQQGYGTANTALTGGGQLLNQGNLALTNALSQAPSFATYPESQYTAAYNAPWLPLSNEASILGGAVGGTGTSQTSQPYYSNTGANILGGLTGGLGLANTIGGASGLFPGAISSGLTALAGF